MQVTYKKPEELLKPLNIPKKLLLGPGPSNVPNRIRHASSLSMLGHLHPEYLAIMEDVRRGLQYLFQTRNELTIAISGSGHAAMEAAIMNVLEAGEKMMVLENGLWGSRAKGYAERIGGKVISLKKSPGDIFTLNEIEQGLSEHTPVVLFVTHGESSTTVVQPLQGIGGICHKYNCLLLVDTVASLGGVPFLMDEWGVDVAYSGSQKVLNCPTGTSPITFSDRARKKIKLRKTKVPSFYFDINLLANYWGIDGEIRSYHHTGLISNVYALREGLSLLVDEGLEESWRRHRANAELLWSSIERLGLTLFIREKSHRLPTVTSVVVPGGIKWKEVVNHLMEKYHIEISGGLGPTAGKIWRIGLMGQNSSEQNIKLLVAALQDALQRLGHLKASL